MNSIPESVLYAIGSAFAESEAKAIDTKPAAFVMLMNLVRIGTSKPFENRKEDDLDVHPN